MDVFIAGFVVGTVLGLVVGLCAADRQWRTTVRDISDRKNSL